MKRLIIMIVLLEFVLVSMVNLPFMASAAEPAPPPSDSIDHYVHDVAHDAVDEIFESLQKLAGPACDLYGLGVDFVNATEWSISESIAEMTALFRNRPWRELIWAVTDEHQFFLAELAKLKKQNCLIDLAISGAGAMGEEEAQENYGRIQRGLEKRMAELEEKVKYFWLQRWHILSPSGPRFIDLSEEEDEDKLGPPKSLEGAASFKPLETLEMDKIFYLLIGPGGLANTVEQFAVETTNFVKRTFQADFGAFLGHIPSTCLDATEVVEKIRFIFERDFVFDPLQEKFVGKKKNKDGKFESYVNFRQFVEKNEKALKESFVDQLCEKKIPPPEVTSAEKQYEKFGASMEARLEQLSTRLEDIDQKLEAIEEEKRKAKQGLSTEKQKARDELITYRGQLIAQIDYYSLVYSIVPPPGSQGLSSIAKNLSDFVEALLGLEKTKGGGVRSRLNLSERTQKIREKKLQEICSRLEAMYRASGRDTASLPEIGVANNILYCQPKSECEQDLIKKNPGISTEIHAGVECEKARQDKLESDQAKKQGSEPISDDIGYLLEKASYEDLLNARDIYFKQQRERYESLYSLQQDATKALMSPLTQVAKNLYFAGDMTNYQAGSNVRVKSHYNVLGKVYDDVAAFMREQKGPSCEAPDTMPKE